VGVIPGAAREIVPTPTLLGTAVGRYQEKFKMELSPHSEVTAENLSGRNVTSIPSIG
jgi:hypothetical protein